VLPFEQMVHHNFPDFYIDTWYMDYLNDICPRCKKKVRVTGTRVENVDAISWFVDFDKKTIVVYCICKRKDVIRE
jgi:hypothetical protein